MGTGKTAVGKELSRMLRMRLVDIDSEIERSQGMAINTIFRDFGEKHFRDIETDMIKRYSRESKLIISTGGGAVLRQENMDALRENGIVFCLSASPETILKRTHGNEDRPLLQVEDPLSRIKELLDFRRPFYEKADILVDTEGKTPLLIAEEIAGIFKCRK
jgi:shikimate kinase